MTEWDTDEQGNERIHVSYEELIPEEANEIDWDDPNDPYNLEADRKLREALKRDAEKQAEKAAEEQAKAEKAKRGLSFTKDELEAYVTYRTKGIAQKSRDWIFRSATALWAITRGEISYETVNALRGSVLEKYQSSNSHSKVLSFAKSFFEHLATIQQNRAIRRSPLT